MLRGGPRWKSRLLSGEVMRRDVLTIDSEKEDLDAQLRAVPDIERRIADLTT